MGLFCFEAPASDKKAKPNKFLGRIGIDLAELLLCPVHDVILSFSVRMVLVVAGLNLLTREYRNVNGALKSR